MNEEVTIVKQNLVSMAVTCLALVGLVVGAATVAHGLDAPGPRERMLRALADWNTTGDPREMIRVFRVWKLTGALDLSDDEIPGFVAKLERIDEKQREAMAGEREMLDELDRLLADKQTGDEELGRALSRLEDARRARAEELRVMRKDAVSGLSARQRCAYEVFESRFRHDMRQLVDRARLEPRGHWGTDLWKRFRPRDTDRFEKEHGTPKLQRSH
jgi:hypothetical protein